MARAKLKADGTIVVSAGKARARRRTGEVDWVKVDATTDKEIARQIASDAADAAKDGAAYARGVRARTRLSQAEFAGRIGVPVETVRNWEQGKRSPRGPARALLKVIDKAPELAFAILDGRRHG